MAAQDPSIVVDAVLAEGGAGQNVKVYPVTIRRYALLEKLGSPFVDPEKEFGVDGIVPSVFVMTRTAEELKQYCNASREAIRDAAFAWSEDLPLDDVPKMVKAVTDQFLNLQKAAPETAPAQDIKKNPTAG
jgi:hypothetical protein